MMGNENLPSVKSSQNPLLAEYCRIVFGGDGKKKHEHWKLSCG